MPDSNSRHVYAFAGYIDGAWKWIGNVDLVPETLREGLDPARYDYYDPDILGSFLDGDGSRAAPAATDQPPTETDLHNAILASRKNAAAKTFDYYAEAHHILDQADGGDSYTFYVMVGYYAYSLSDGAWKSEVGGDFSAAVTFAAQDGGWVLAEYWEPQGGAHYGPDIRAKFSPKAADALLSGENDAWWADLQNQCDDAAVRYFAQTTGEVPAKTFTKADVEFSGQSLTASPDPMTYDQRLAWVRTAASFESLSYVPTHAYLEGEGCIAYTGYWAGTPHMDQYGLDLRFADGSSAALPLPSSGVFSIAVPETMTFRENTFLYTVTFPETSLMNEGQSLTHLKGVYRYEVDLTEKTVSLTVEDL